MCPARRSRTSPGSAANSRFLVGIGHLRFEGGHRDCTEPGRADGYRHRFSIWRELFRPLRKSGHEIRRFTRLALGFSKKLENLEAAIALYVAHHNYCRYHRTIRSTPAMAAGIAGHPWTMEELLTNAGL
jgi:hypothetical protein